jgi:chemosensory pili system protein ChpC
VSQEGDPLRCLLVPLDGDRLLLPSAAVAEVSAYTQPVAVADSPPWLVGEVRWREQRLPLLSLEVVLRGGVSSPADARCRIVVLYALAGARDPAFYGLLCRDIPKALRLTREDLRPVELPPGYPGGEVAAVEGERVGRALVPDLETLEHRLLAPLRAARRRSAEAGENIDTHGAGRYPSAGRSGGARRGRRVSGRGRGP